MRRNAAHLCLALSLCLGISGCFEDPVASTTQAEGSESGDGDGDDPSGDGDGDSGDGDGDPSTGDGDGEPPCVGEGCPCEVAEDCDEGLICDEGLCIEELCGDGQQTESEQCDDGNSADGDGCDNDCTYTDILYVGGGGAHTCALIEGGRVRCWGWNGVGQLGLAMPENIGDDELPSAADDVELPGPASQLAVGDQHNCAVVEEQVYCWGQNDDGRVGVGSTEIIGDDEAPQLVELGAPAKEVEGGAFHSCARLNDNSVRCWGEGSLGRLGYGNTMDVGDDELPAEVGPVMLGGQAARLTVGGAHTCAITPFGRVRCWGRNEQGQLGYGNTQNIGDDELPSSAGDVSAIPVGVPANTKIEEVSHGVTHTCALYETGEVLCWGSGVFGEIGLGSTSLLGDDELPSTRPPIELPGPAVAISAGGGHSCALLEGGELYCWGANTFGELGYGNTNTIGNDEVPADVDPVPLGAPAVAVGAGFFHTCAILETNELRCWGSNDAGQLGLGNTSKVGDDELPTDVPPVELF